MNELVPGLARLRAMLQSVGSTKLVIGGTVILLIAGGVYINSQKGLFADPKPLDSSTVVANVAPIGTVKLTEPPAPPAEEETTATETETSAEVSEPAESETAATETASEVSEPAESETAATETASEVSEPAESETAATETASEVSEVSEVSEPAESQTAATETASEVSEPAESQIVVTETPAETSEPATQIATEQPVAPTQRPQPAWMLHMQPLPGANR